MPSYACDAEVIRNVVIGEGLRRLELMAPLVAATASPGQFVMVESGAKGTLLRRPLGISGAEPKSGTVTLRFAVIGKGTGWLAERGEGDIVALSGPFGKGFTRSGINAVLIGGGTGIAPLLFLKEEIEGRGGRAVLVAGARSGTCLMEAEGLPEGCVACTEDGSLGEEGLVTGPLIRLLDGMGFDSAYACGPVPMLRAVKALLKGYGVPLQVSLETVMGCGIGACNGCACEEARKGAGWFKVCKDGPVFLAEEVLL